MCESGAVWVSHSLHLISAVKQRLTCKIGAVYPASQTEGRMTSSAGLERIVPMDLHATGLNNAETTIHKKLQDLSIVAFISTI